MEESKGKILIIDDDPFVRSMLEEILQSENYVVRTAKNGKDGLDKYRSEPDIELVVSDMNMAEMGGVEFIKEMRKLHFDIPIIILTVNKDIFIALEAIRSGAEDYLLKDENIQQTIVISVEKVLEKYRLKLQNKQLLVELLYKNEELERLTYQDGLTCISNRRYFENIILLEWGRSVREQKPISLIMIDIDFFKSYNDTYGHLFGDDCLLKQVARALNGSFEKVWRLSVSIRRRGNSSPFCLIRICREPFRWRKS